LPFQPHRTIMPAVNAVRHFEVMNRRTEATAPTWRGA
jgi:hypothetical protein